MADRTEDFAERLKDLEDSGDVEAFVTAVFAIDVVLLRPETGRELTGLDGARTFWQEYLDQFSRVDSTFNRISSGQVGVLEWTSAARLRNDIRISYAGVSLLDFDDQGKVQRFSTYYDTSAFDSPQTLTA